MTDGGSSGAGARDEDEGAEKGAYEVVIAPSALRKMAAIPSKADRRSVDKVICILDTVPDIGRKYDPLYEAARPEGDVMVVYAGHYGIYYEVLEEEKLVAVYHIEDQRRDPLKRFED